VDSKLLVQEEAILARTITDFKEETYMQKYKKMRMKAQDTICAEQY